MRSKVTGEQGIRCAGCRWQVRSKRGEQSDTRCLVKEGGVEGDGDKHFRLNTGQMTRAE